MFYDIKPINDSAITAGFTTLELMKIMNTRRRYAHKPIRHRVYFPYKICKFSFVSEGADRETGKSLGVSNFCTAAQVCQSRRIEQHNISWNATIRRVVALVTLGTYPVRH
jgi:hypothetical protein